MTSILCLAHYCDLHGPTPLMVTEGLPVACGICCDEPQGLRGGASTFDRPRTRVPTSGESTHTANVAEALRRMSIAGPHRSSSVPATEQEAEAQAHRASLRHAAKAAAAATSGSAIETPPQSPQLSEGSGVQQRNARRDSGFRRTYDDYVTRRAGPCENCALTLPKRQEGNTNVGIDSRLDRGPTLRTRAPCARVFTGFDVNTSPPTSQSSSSSPSEDESGGRPRVSHRRTATGVSLTSRSSGSSGSTAASVHTHYLDYTSTHEPIVPSSFSLVRASCLRTLSLETLPRAPATSPPSAGAAIPTPGGSPNSPGIVTTHSIGAAASGGSIFFGDKKVGYTTAYIFRVPDVHARGHKRVYAFLALSTHPEPVAVKTFTFLSTAFRDLASWIQELAEAEAERAQAESSGSTASSPVVPGPGYGSFQSEPAAPPVSATTSSSSFLMGGVGGLSRRMGGGFGASGVALKQRGLAELVGLPDFFIELHARFVRLLLEIGVMVGS
ncbi:vesicle coat protein [Chaetomium strumarium]|uniref:Vesicle coat protein n=1 Tax=Chaetomium strumarium TaxID=1170767 RepID=A0AAJ0M1V8_9PEZI|nr:vesicle coat protein [Chaetomium strumarium]